MMTNFKRIFVPLIKTLGGRKEKRIFSDTPIIIGGSARSGTTFLLSILSAHPAIFAFKKELSLFKYGIEQNGRFMPKRIDRLYFAILKTQINKKVSRWCEKTPNNIRYIERIDSFLKGKYRFIHIVRDGRDVILSRHPHDDDRYYMVEPGEWVRDVQEGIRHMDRENFLTIRYESLIGDFHNTMSRICDHLGIEMTEEISNFYEHATVRKNPAYFSGLERMHSKSVGKWKDPENKDRVDELLKHPGAIDLLKKLNYL